MWCHLNTINIYIIFFNIQWLNVLSRGVSRKGLAEKVTIRKRHDNIDSKNLKVCHTLKS